MKLSLLFLLDELLVLLLLRLIIPFTLLTELNAKSGEELLFIMFVGCTFIENHQFGPAGYLQRRF